MEVSQIGELQKSSASPIRKPDIRLPSRLLGILGIFLNGVISGRAMSVSWQQPCPFDLIFDSPNIDWSQPYITAATPGHAIYANETLTAERKDVDLINWGGGAVDGYFSRGIRHDLWSPAEPWLRVRCGIGLDFEGSLTHHSYTSEQFKSNRGIVIRSFQYAGTAERLRALGFQDSTAYNCLISYLIRPKPAALMFIQQYSSLFALPSVFSIGIQVRTGDHFMVRRATNGHTVSLS